MGIGINKILKYFSLKVLFLEFRRAKLLWKFKNKELTIGLGTNIKNAEIGFRIFMEDSTIFANSTIGDYSYISSDSHIRNARIGKFCSIGPGVKINIGNHPSDMVSTHPAFYANHTRLKTFSDKMYFEEFKEVNIGNDVLIGMDAIILSGISIGDGAIVTSRAVVTKNVPPYAIVGGVPAKLIKYRFSEEIIEKLKTIEWWNKDENWLKSNYLTFHNPNEFVNQFYDKRIDE